MVIDKPFGILYTTRVFDVNRLLEKVSQTSDRRR